MLAPDGGPLEPRTYTGATAWPYYEGGPGMVLNSNLGGCDGDLVGSFTIQDIRFGPYNYLEKLDATFEQHCSGGAPAARGQVHLTNPPPPAPLDPQATVAGTGTVVMPDGPVTVRGTVTCSQAALVFVDAQVQQNGRLVGLDRAEVQCLPGQAVPWTATRTEPSGVRFRPGDADVRLHISGHDPFYDRYVDVVPPPFPVRLDVA